MDHIELDLNPSIIKLNIRRKETYFLKANRQLDRGLREKSDVSIIWSNKYSSDFCRDILYNPRLSLSQTVWLEPYKWFINQKEVYKKDKVFG